MAWHDRLIIKNDMNPKETLEQFLEIGSIECVVQTRNIRKDYVLYVAECKDLFDAYASKAWIPYRKDIDFHLNVSIGLNLDMDNGENTRIKIIELLIMVSLQTNWDFALYHDDTLIIMYKSKQLILNKLAYFWKSEDNLQLVSFPYIFDEIPD